MQNNLYNTIIICLQVILYYYLILIAYYYTIDLFMVTIHPFPHYIA